MRQAVIAGVNYIIGTSNKSAQKSASWLCDDVKRNLSNLIGSTECRYAL